MPDIKKIYCNTCNYETKHELLSSHDRDYSLEENLGSNSQEAWYETWKYCFWVCRGCDTATLEEKHHCSGMYNNNGDDTYSYKYFPARSNISKREPKKFLHIDRKLNSAYRELIKAHQHGLEIICAIGVRALLEGICVKEGLDDKKAWGLNKKIELLQAESKIPPSIIDGLKSLKFIGDDAAHRLNSADKNSIELSISLLEALLTHLYEAKSNLQHSAELIKRANKKEIQPTTNSTG